MRVLVTGHNGYIGTRLMPMLRQAGHDAVGLDTNYFVDCTIHDPPVDDAPVIKDIRDIEPRDIAGFDAVIHLAALSNDPLGDIDPRLTTDVNLNASIQLAGLAKAAGVERFVFSSSCSVYGAAGPGEECDEHAPLEPLTPYAVSKARTEQHLLELADDAFSPVLLRNATAYGVSARLRADIVINNLVCWACTTGRIRILTDGTPWRPLVHIEDICLAFVAALTAPRQAIHRQTYNVGVPGENHQVRDLAEIVRQTVPGCVVAYGDRPSPDARDYCVDCRKIIRELPGYEPRWTVRAGAEEVYKAVLAADLTEADFQGGRCNRLARLRDLMSRRVLDDSLRWTDVSTPQPAARPSAASA